MDIEKRYLWFGLLFLILVTSLAINLSVSLPEKLAFGDEGFYASIGQYMGENLEIPVENPFLGSEAFTEYLSKAPMTFLSLASFYLFAGKMGMRALVPIISIISASMLFLLAKKMHSTKAGVFAVLFYLTMPALITHTIFLYTEHLALMFLIGSFYFFYNYLETEKTLKLVLSGILLGFSINTEPTALLAAPILLIVLYKYKVAWSQYFKEIITLGVLAFLVISPWMIAHNYYHIGDPGFQINSIPGVEFSPKSGSVKEIPEIGNEGLKKPSEVGQGTAAPLNQFGLLNYGKFAYTLPIFMMAIIGFSLYAVDWKDKYLITVLWAFIFFGSVYFLMAGSRVEGLSRNTLFVIAPISIMAGFFGSKIYEYLTSFKALGKTLGVAFLMLVLAWSLATASSKAESLRPIKHFSDSFFVGCDWIRENTEEESIVYTLWAPRAQYHCKRSIVGNSDPGMESAILASDNRTYDVLKAHGIDYLYIQKFSIKQGRKRVSYPLKFIQYIERSPHYEQVYSYPQNCLYNQQVSDCVIIYKLLEEKTVTENQTVDIQQLTQ